MNPRALADSLLRESLAAFIERVFYTLNPGQTFYSGYHIRALAYKLEQVERGKIRRLAIAMPPRHLKSICTSVAFPAWELGRDPSRRIIAASYGIDLAHGFSLQTRQVMEQDWYRRIFPGTIIDPRRNNIDEFRTTRHGGRIATSVGGVLTGKGGNTLIIDDPMKAADAFSESARQAKREWFQTTVLSRLDDPKHDAIVMLSQRLHVDDLIGLTIEQGGWDYIEIPAIAIEHQTIPIAENADWIRQPGDILQPERVGKAELDQLRRDMGSAAFDAQYQQRPVPAEGNLIKLEWLKRYDENDLPSLPHYEAIVQCWDTAMVPGEGNDYNVCTTWGILGERFYLLDIFREQLNYPDLRRSVIRLRRERRAMMVLVEWAGSGVSLSQDLDGYGGDRIYHCNPKDNKVTRVAHQSAKIEAGHVYLPRKASWLSAFETEIAAFPNGKHDDQVDSMTMFLRNLDQRPNPIRHLSYYAGK
jgi:predicted phage terminase large subunit-like protein